MSVFSEQNHKTGTKFLRVGRMARKNPTNLRVAKVEFVPVPDAERHLAALFDLLLNSQAARDGPDASDAGDSCAGCGDTPEPPARGKDYVQ